MTGGPHAGRLPGRGWLKHGGTPGNWDNAPRCGAKTRKGTPCRSAAMKNGRCRMHGGMSTGPRTPEGIERIRKARTKHGRYSQASIRSVDAPQAIGDAALLKRVAVGVDLGWSELEETGLEVAGLKKLLHAAILWSGAGRGSRWACGATGGNMHRTHVSRSAFQKLAMLAIGLVGTASAVPFHVNAQKAAKWAQVGGWDIRVDESVGNGCFAMQTYEDGTVARIGVDVSQQRIYLLFLNEAWKSLEVGKIYPVRVVFDGVSTYNGDMKGHRLAGGAIVLSHSNLSSEFVKDFMQRNGMRIYYQGSSIASLSLRNTYAAIGEVFNCQKEFGFGSGSSQNSDPFSSSSGGRPNRDPFR
jgi:hypothetical protein